MTATRADASLWPVPTEADLRRFFIKCAISPATGCWVWLGQRNEAGYGRFRYAGKKQMAHAFATFMVGRPCPVGMEHDHLCRNKPCVNPEHLDQTTTMENKRRQRYAVPTCAQGHLWTPANTRWASKGHGDAPYRQCRRCRADLAVRRRARGLT